MPSMTTATKHLSLAGGVNSPVRSKIPFTASSARGATITSASGDEYLDFCQSWGANILGAADPIVLEAVHQQCLKGTSYGVTCEREHELAHLITSSVDSVEKIRFVSSGTEATMTAIRIARGYTGKSHILKFDGNYHGHADPFLVNAGSGLSSLPESSSAGVPEAVTDMTISVPYNDFESVEQAFLKYEFAAVIVEPIAGNMGLIPAQKEWLLYLRDLCSKTNTVLIFDEVISGFRVGFQGAQGLYGITPDLTTFGKVIGAGFPVGAVGGRKRFMDLLAPTGTVYQAGTLSGNPVAMTAGCTALTELQKRDGYTKLEKLGSYLEERLGNVPLHRVGSMFTLFFGIADPQRKRDVDRADHEAYNRYFHHCLENGIFIPPLQYETCFLSLAHTEEMIDHFASVTLDFVMNL